MPGTFQSRSVQSSKPRVMPLFVTRTCVLRASARSMKHDKWTAMPLCHLLRIFSVKQQYCFEQRCAVCGSSNASDLYSAYTQKAKAALCCPLGLGNAYLHIKRKGQWSNLPLRRNSSSITLLRDLQVVRVGKPVKIVKVVSKSSAM
jgi:hypothetical protein